MGESLKKEGGTSNFADADADADDDDDDDDDDEAEEGDDDEEAEEGDDDEEAEGDDEEEEAEGDDDQGGWGWSGWSQLENIHPTKMNIGIWTRMNPLEKGKPQN